MPAPYPRRPPIQGVARATNRGAKGQAQGRFPGLGQVRRKDTPRSVEPVEAVWTNTDGNEYGEIAYFPNAVSFPGGNITVGTTWTPVPAERSGVYTTAGSGVTVNASGQLTFRDGIYRVYYDGIFDVATTPSFGSVRLEPFIDGGKGYHHGVPRYGTGRVTMIPFDLMTVVGAVDIDKPFRLVNETNATVNVFRVVYCSFIPIAFF